MKDYILVIVAFVAFVGFVGLTIWWQVYKYQDCKRVGHSTVY